MLAGWVGRGVRPLEGGRTMGYMEHSRHSRLVSRLCPDESLHVRDWSVHDEVCHRLCSPEEGYAIIVYFSEVPSHPDHIILRATNWRAEDEPRGWVSRQRAREIYRELRSAGFVPHHPG